MENTMGIFGFGEDDKKGSTPNSALERAGAVAEPSGLTGMATNLVERLLDTGIEGRGPFASAQQVADSALRHSRDADAAIERVVRSHLAYGGAGGFVTGLGGFVTMPVALPANVVEFYLVATRMTAAVAALRGYDIRQGQIRTAVLLTLVGADADDLLKKAGIVATGSRLTNLAAQRLPGPALMVVNKAIGFRLLSQVGRSTFARFGKALPLVGGVVGAGLDVYLLRRIADNARREFPRNPTPAIGPNPAA
jgi:hypothetical protein